MTRYTFTFTERRLLADALRFSARVWRWDADKDVRLGSAAWLDGLKVDRITLVDERVKDWFSCLGYLITCEEDPAKRQAGRELMLKLAAPFGKTLTDVDRVLVTARTYIKKGWQ